MSTTRPYTPTQVFFLGRLQRLIEAHEHLDAMALWQRDLLRRATLSTYIDCLALGLDLEAGGLLGQLRRRTDLGKGGATAARSDHDDHGADGASHAPATC